MIHLGDLVFIDISLENASYIFVQTPLLLCRLLASRAARIMRPPTTSALPEKACAPAYEPLLNAMIAPQTGEPSKAPIPIAANTIPNEDPIFDVSEMMTGTIARESDWTPPTDRL
jgi:hypothetical protein